MKIRIAGPVTVTAGSGGITRAAAIPVPLQGLYVTTTHGQDQGKTACHWSRAASNWGWRPRWRLCRYWLAGEGYLMPTTMESGPASGSV